MAKRYYDQALETSADAYFPATLSLISLYARAAYHAIFTSPDDELKALSLFGNVVGGGGGQEELGASWSFGRAWREIQRRWGVDVPPEQVNQMPVVDNRDQHGEEWAPEDLHEAQRQLEGNDDAMDWAGRRTGGRMVDDDDEDFFLDGEGDLGGTVAIVALCVILG
jgi:SEL1 protein